MDIGLGKEHGSPGLAVEPRRAGMIAHPADRFVKPLGDVIEGMELRHSCPPALPNRVMRSMTGSAIAAHSFSQKSVKIARIVREVGRAHQNK